MARSVSRAQRAALRGEFADEVMPLMWGLLETWTFVLVPTLSPENKADQQAVKEMVARFMQSYLSNQTSTPRRRAPEAAPNVDPVPRRPRRQRRTDPEGIDWRLRVFRGRVFALRAQDSPPQSQAKAIRTEASNLLTDLPPDHEARDEVFEILCAADDIVSD